MGRAEGVDRGVVGRGTEGAAGTEAVGRAAEGARGEAGAEEADLVASAADHLAAGARAGAGEIRDGRSKG